MDCKELRIGNWVQDSKTKDVFEVCGIKEDGIFAKGGNESGLDYHPEPIPLTEEWLVRLGFEIKEDRAVSRYWKYEFLYDLKDNTFNMFFSMDEGDFSVTIKYVHQLQNLYFALTGEELNYV